MKTIILYTIVTVIFLTSVSFAQSDLNNPSSTRLVDFLVVPADYENNPGTAVFTGPLATTARTYQLLIEESLLTSILGMEIQTISFRIPTSATANWPAAETVYSSFDVYMSPSVSPSARSLVFAENIAGPQKNS